MPPEVSRAAALMAARELLIEAGPQAVTLKAVATRINRTHANLLHHFGSAAGLQKALAEYLAGTVCDAIGAAVRATGADAATPRDVVDLAFDAFGREGARSLVSWMLMSGNEDALEPIVETIHELVAELNPQELQSGADRTIHQATYTLVLLAMGDALMGQELAGSLSVSRQAARDNATEMMTASLIKAGDIKG